VKRSLLPLLLLSVFSLPALSQDLNGIWKGTLTLGPGGCFTVYNLEMQITVTDSSIKGISYHYSDTRNYVKENFIGTYHRSTKSVAIQEQSVVTFHVPPDCIPCIKRYTLQYGTTDGKETLSGEMGGRMMNNNGVCPPGKIVLSRIKQSAFEHVREIDVDTGTLRLDFYDNAQIDGDTISVLHNNQMIVSHQGLSLKPITVEIKVDFDHPEHEIVMIGENLGSIPPNTALLIVTAGTQRYKLYLTSTEQTSATVRFVYRKRE